jgi:hypothetical protein
MFSTSRSNSDIGRSSRHLADPMDHRKLHDSDWATERVAWAAVKLAIGGGVDKARAAANIG